MIFLSYMMDTMSDKAIMMPSILATLQVWPCRAIVYVFLRIVWEVKLLITDKERTSPNTPFAPHSRSSIRHTYQSWRMPIVT